MIRRLCVCGRAGTKRRRSKVSPSEGNEVRREDCQEVAASRSTAEPGEPPEGPWGGKECESTCRWRETCQVRRDLIRVSTKRQRIAELAENCPDMAFTNLSHHIDMEWMLTAHGRTRRDGAVGVDGQTADEYEVNLEGQPPEPPRPRQSGTTRCHPCVECIFPRQARLPRLARWEYQRMKIKFFSVRC